MSSNDRLSQESCTRCRNSVKVVAGSEEVVNSLFILLAREVGVHHEEHVASLQSYVDLRCPAEKALNLPVDEMTVAPVQCSGHCLF